MNTRQNIGFRGVRTGLWAEDKWTNTNRFDPQIEEIDHFVRHDYSETRLKEGPVLLSKPAHQAFVRPFTEVDVEMALAAVPQEYLDGLGEVILLAGTKKQEQAFKRCFAYGRYSSRRIFLHPYPKNRLNVAYRSMRPHELIEYERAGAHIKLDRRYCHIRFDEASLRQFYLQDVLMHELGHHVDAMSQNRKSVRKAEYFAHWFASVYGYKLRVGA